MASPCFGFAVRLPISLSAEEGVVPCAPRLIGEPVVTLIGHERDGFNLHLKDREEEAVPLLGNLESSHRNDNALLSWREEAPRRHDRVVSPVLCPKNDVPDFAHDLVI